MCGINAATTPKLNDISADSSTMQFKQELRETFRSSLHDGRLEEALASLKRQKQAEETEGFRRSLQNTFQASLDSGRLFAVMTEIKERKEAAQLEALRQRMQQSLTASVENGSLSKVIASVKRKHEEQEVETFRQDMRSTFQASLDDGRLREVLSPLKRKKEAQEAEESRQACREALRSGLEDGRLAQALQQVKRDREAAEEEQMRTDMRETLRAALDSGRLKAVMQEIKQGREAEEMRGCRDRPSIMSAIPVRPSTAKTASRPSSRRSSTRTGISLEQSPQQTSSMRSMPLPRPRSSSSCKASESMQQLDSLGAASPVKPQGKHSLPPVTPPCRKHKAKPPLATSSHLQQSQPSAMSLDLGSSTSIGLGYPSASIPGRKESSPRSRCFWEDVHKTSPAASFRSSSLTTYSMKAPSFLPDIAGTPRGLSSVSKASAHKRSSSLDVAAWSVSNARSACIDWGR